jgi:isocitrate dehydrogenase
MVIFRENIEDVYAGIEFKAGSAEAEKLRAVPREGDRQADPPGLRHRHQADVGVRLQAAHRDGHPLRHPTHRPSVTMMHKGNIMKFTEGAFRDWGYELAIGRSSGQVVTEADLYAAGGGARRQGDPQGRIADSMFQQILLRPDGVLGGGDAQPQRRLHLRRARGRGRRPRHRAGRPTWATRPRCSRPRTAPPPSTPGSTRSIRARHPLGRDDARAHGLGRGGEADRRGIEKAIAARTVTYDLARQMPGATEVSTSGFGDAIIKGMSA